MYSVSQLASPPVVKRRAWFSSGTGSGGSAVASGSSGPDSWTVRSEVGEVVQGEGSSPSEGSKSVRSESWQNWTMLAMNWGGPLVSGSPST